jgi:hypothetical protein
VGRRPLLQTHEGDVDRVELLELGFEVGADLPHEDRDKGVVTYQGRREEEDGGDEDLIGSGDGAQFFDFKARAAGRTTVKLLFCPHGLCGSAAEVSASPVPTVTDTEAPTKSDDRVAYYVYTITVR